MLWGVAMKKYFNYFFILMILVLSFLIYQQWFSSFAPVEYYLPLESTAPRHLEFLTVKDFQGNSIDINFNDSPKTLIIAERFSSKNDPKHIIYNILSPSFIYRSLNNMGIRTVHIWIVNNKEDVEIIENQVSPLEIDSRYYMNLRTLIAYQEKGLNVGKFLVAAYNDQGDLLYERRNGNSFSPTPNILADEIIKGVNIR